MRQIPYGLPMLHLLGDDEFMRWSYLMQTGEDMGKPLHQEMTHAAGQLRGSFFVSTLSLNIPYQILEDTQRNSRKLPLAFATFPELAGKMEKYSQ